MNLKDTIPMVHLNGTSKEELLEKREDVYRELTVALAKLKQMAPHERDYYPNGNTPDENGKTVFTKARDLHQKRMLMITDLMNELEEEAKLIQDK